MALHHQIDGEDPVRGTGGVRLTDLGSDHHLLRDGVSQLAHGALVCPGCSAPVTIADTVAAGAELECSFCAERGRATDFLVRDVYDTPANEVLLIARVGSAAW